MKVILLLLFAMLSTAASADTINWTISGAYTGQGTVSGWICNFRADLFVDHTGVDNRRLRANCVAPDGAFHLANTTTASTCPSENTVMYLGDLGGGGNAGPGNPVMRITQVLNGNIECPGGLLRIEIGGVSNLWCKRTPVTVTPYAGCGTTSFNSKR